MCGLNLSKSTMCTLSLGDESAVLFNRFFAALFQVKMKDRAMEMEAYGYVSNANYNVKKGTFVFFINSMYLAALLSMR